MALVFDHAPMRWREIAFFAASKSLWDEYRKYRDQRRNTKITAAKLKIMGSKLWPIGTIRGHRHACVTAGVVIFWMTTLALVDLVSPRLFSLAIAA